LLFAGSGERFHYYLRSGASYYTADANEVLGVEGALEFVAGEA